MWINYKQYGLKHNLKTNGVYAIIRIEDNKVMSVGSTKDLYDRFHQYNTLFTFREPHGIKSKEIIKAPEKYTIKILEQNIDEELLRERESHWQRTYHTNYREGGWDIYGARYNKREQSKRNYNKDKEVERHRKRFIEHPEKHEAAKERQKQWYYNNKEESKAKRKMQTIFKDEPLSVRKFYKVNFGSWVEGLIAYEIYEATVRS